jgi:small conductance mechanosensitive channel
VDYDSDMETVRRVALDAVNEIPGRLEDPAPQILYQGYGDSTMNLTVFYWIDTTKTDPFVARDTGLLSIYAAFNRAGIHMPFPTQTLVTPGLSPISPSQGQEPDKPAQ